MDRSRPRTSRPRSASRGSKGIASIENRKRSAPDLTGRREVSAISPVPADRRRLGDLVGSLVAGKVAGGDEACGLARRHGHQRETSAARRCCAQNTRLSSKASVPFARHARARDWWFATSARRSSRQLARIAGSKRIAARSFAGSRRSPLVRSDGAPSQVVGQAQHQRRLRDMRQAPPPPRMLPPPSPGFAPTPAFPRVTVLEAA